MGAGLPAFSATSNLTLVDSSPAGRPQALKNTSSTNPRSSRCLISPPHMGPPPLSYPVVYARASRLSLIILH